MKKIELDLRVDAALNELSEQIKALPRVRDGKIYEVPAAIQKRAVGIFHGSGISVADLAKRIGMSGSTVRNWIGSARKNLKKRTLKSARAPCRAAKFREVKVRPETKPAVTQSRALTLELASGAKVHGLSLSEIRELVSMGGAQ